VSIKYILVATLILYALEILILPYIGHGREGFRETLPFWSQQELFQQGAMLRLCATTMLRSTLLECIDDALIQISHDQICHCLTHQISDQLIAMIALIDNIAIIDSILVAAVV
jgi:hypothetical protein